MPATGTLISNILGRAFNFPFRLATCTSVTIKMDDSEGLAIAFEEAKLSYSEGGIPVSWARFPPKFVD